MPLNRLLQFQVQRLAGLRFLYITALFSLFFSNMEPNLELRTKSETHRAHCSKMIGQLAKGEIPLNPNQKAIKSDLDDFLGGRPDCKPKCPQDAPKHDEQFKYQLPIQIGSETEQKRRF